MRSKLIKGKVAEAFQRFSDRKIWLLPRDHSLFTKKTMDERLKGDDDALLCCLRSVEVAMAAFERRQSQAATNAALFFQPFRTLGLQRLAMQRMTITASQQDQQSLPSNQAAENIGERVNHSGRESDQLESEVSSATQSQYLDRSNKMAVVEGLQNTLLYSAFEDEQQVNNTILSARKRWRTV